MVITKLVDSDYQNLPMRDMPHNSFGRIVKNKFDEDEDGSHVGDVVYRDIDGAIVELWPQLEVYGPMIDGYFVDIISSSVKVTVTID